MSPGNLDEPYSALEQALWRLRVTRMLPGIHHDAHDFLLNASLHLIGESRNDRNPLPGYESEVGK